MLTALGKELRILRINNNEILKDMASRLDITSAYLSAIENGKREPTEKFMESLFETYNLSDTDKEIFRDAYFVTIDNVKIDLSSQPSAQKDLSLIFARKINNLSDVQIEKLMKILNKGE